jgi:metallo-beta-lactamase family protein
LKLFRHVRYGHKTELGHGVSFTFLDAGHILGSAFVVLEWTEHGRNRSLLFTGDVGRYHTPILRDPAPVPGPFEQIITESTYGTTDHAPMDQVEPQFLEAVKYCVEHRSRLLIPAFAVGRTQTMLWYLQKFVHEGSIPQVPTFVDSPMGIEISRIHQEHTENYDDETRRLIGDNDLFGLARVTFARSSAQSRQINSVNGTALIIASSPSCEFGRILHHLKISLEREHDMIIFVGWTPPRTLGRRIQEGQKRVRVYDRWYDLRCQIRTLHGLSAHADGNELLKFLAPTLRPETTAYVVHGEVEQAEGFSKRLLDAGVGRTMIPAMESSVINL